MLQRIADFAMKHELRWGASKCEVMRVGKHKEPKKEWKLGEITIQETESYKYLGDLITGDGKNSKNLDQRKSKITAATTTINAIAETEVLRSEQSEPLISSK